MVCVRLVDCPDSPEEHPPPPIPEMMFAVGEEPVGVRVLTYLTSGAINRIFNALEEEEFDEYIRLLPPVARGLLDGAIRLCLRVVFLL
ncbi:hypothetical protein F2Q68_00029674 [Brassica cretica]|uniref:Uncharacterized protein n=1 Tax=Brassica cretica TaxID=69181 RepID=A0A8S9G8D7_BRACR|nr:hypothetical protein F2Q68_00029674 [Brassica cretica]